MKYISAVLNCLVIVLILATLGTSITQTLGSEASFNPGVALFCLGLIVIFLGNMLVIWRDSNKRFSIAAIAADALFIPFMIAVWLISSSITAETVGKINQSLVEPISMIIDAAFITFILVSVINILLIALQLYKQAATSEVAADQGSAT